MSKAQRVESVTNGGAPWLSLACLVAVIAVFGVTFRDTLHAVVDAWNSESFAHGWIVPPIAAWLVWRRRDDLAGCTVTPFWPAVAGLGICGFGWLVGRLAGVNTVEQFAVVGMIQCAVALTLGWRVYWTIAFPMLFLFFAVPFGQFLQPPLMEMTATFTVEAVRLSGVPIVREGLHFSLPTGRWSVVEACSGLRYLLAALPIACIYAYLSYRSFRARVMFVATVVVVAVVANWLRAYLIVMLGHLSGMKLAVGVDHIIYGWVFFGIVMALSFWAGSFWEDPPDHAIRRAGASPVTGRASAGPHPSGSRILSAAVAGAAGVAIWPFGAHALFTLGQPSVDLSALAPVVVRAELPADNTRYFPMYTGGIDRLFGQTASDAEVGVYVAHYLRQNERGEMVTWGNRVVPAGPEDLTWKIVESHPLDAKKFGARFPGAPVNEYLVDGPSGRYLVWEWFWVNGREFNDPRRIKIQTALDLIRGRGDESLAWFVWTPAGDSPDAMRGKLARAVNSLDGAARLARAQ